MRHAILALLIALVPVTTVNYRHEQKAVLNNLQTTPGAVNPELTQAVVCSPKFRTGPYRHVTEKMKREVCAEYGQSNCPSHQYEIDHLISIELGGSNSIQNLWPEPVDQPGVIGFHTKDVVENRAHKAVCDGQITLQQAQQAIRTNWYQFGLAHGWITRTYK